MGRLTTMDLIGDVHGKFDEYRRIIEESYCSIQLGDMGIGFPSHPYPKSWDKSHLFIRGNHDNPEACKKHPNFLGDFGSITKDVYFISGAYSIDKNHRTFGVDWWDEEEITTSELMKAVESYGTIKPSVVFSHTAPTRIATEILSKKIQPSRTMQAMELMLLQHSPELWVFAHYHISADIVRNGCRFIALNELETVSLGI